MITSKVETVMDFAGYLVVETAEELLAEYLTLHPEEVEYEEEFLDVAIKAVGEQFLKEMNYYIQEFAVI